MNHGWRDVRSWVGAAFAAAQLAAVAAGLLPWPAALATLGLTWLVTRRSAPARPGYVRTAQVLALLLVLAAGLHIAVDTRAALAADGLDPVTTLRSLSWLLIALSLVMAPSWQTGRDYRVWITVTAGVLVAAASPPASGGWVAPATATLLVAWGVLLVALIVVQRASIEARVTVVTASSGGPPPAAHDSMAYGARLVVPVGASLIAGALVFAALPGTLGGGGLSGRLAHDLHSRPSDVTATRETAGIDTMGTGDLDLQVRGQLPLTPVLRVPARSPALWRGTVYSTYTGQSWQATGYPVIRFSVIAGSSDRLPATAADPPAPGSTRHRYLVQPETPSGLSLVWSPGVLLNVAGSFVRNVAQGQAFTRVLSMPEGSPYTVTAAVPSASPSRLASTPATATPDGVWTSLPTRLPARVSTLARSVTAAATSRYEQVSDLESYLRGHETYSLTSPVPTGNQDAVDDFLFRDHVGFCEQFASAEAVMLRTLGVPARVVTGLAYGTRQGATRLMRADDAHAWVEVYYPNAGWVPTDPTAGVRLAAATTSTGSWLDRSLRRMTGAVPGGGFGILVILVVAVLTTSGIGASRSRRSARQPVRTLVDPSPLPVLASFLRFTARQPPTAARTATETAREYVARTSATGRLRSAVTTLEDECYGADVPDAREVVDAVAAFDEAT